METDSFSRALAALASPAVDPNARREAEAFVTAAGEDPGVVLALLRHLEPTSAVAPETRHLAAVLLATSAGKHWRSLDDHVRRATQRGVLAALAHAEDPATLRALAHAADVVAQSSTTTSTPWDELLPSLSEAAKSPKDAHREAASLLLGNLVESMGAHLEAHHEALVAALAAASAADASAGAAPETPARRRARRAALGALAQLASALGASGDFRKVATLVPRIIERCLQAAVEYSEWRVRDLETPSPKRAEEEKRRDFSGVAAALRALAAAVAVDADAVFGPDLRLLCPTAETALAVATRGHADAAGPEHGEGPAGTAGGVARAEARDDARAAAFEALEALASTHSGALDEPIPAAAAAAAAAGASAKDAPRTIAAMLLPPLCAAARDESATAGAIRDANDDSETRGVAAAARAALRQCALRFPPSVVLPHALGPVVDAGAKGVAPSAGALSAFAAVVEGCAHDAVDDDATVRRVLTALRLGVESGDAATARAAATATMELTEHAGHALASLHGEAVASLLCVAVRAASEAESRLGNADADLVEGFAAPTHAATVAFVENCGDEEMRPETLRSLAAALVGGACAASTPARACARCLATLAAVVTAAASGFEPYAGETLGALATLAGTAGDAASARAESEAAADAVRARALAAMASVIASTGADHGFLDAVLAAATRRLSEDSNATSVSRECALRCFARLAAALGRRLAPWIAGAAGSATRALAAVTSASHAAPGGGRRGRSAVTTGDVGEAVAAAETLGALANCCGAAARDTARASVAALVAAADAEGAAPPALRIAALRALEFSTHPADEDAEAAPPIGAMAAAAPEAAAALFADATRALAGAVARDDAPEAALAAATSLETVAERCRRAADAFAANGSGALASVLAATVEEAIAACDAVKRGVAACQAELAEGGGGGHEGRDGEDTVDIFFDLEDQTKRVASRLDSV